MMRKFITALTACAMLVPASFVKVQADDGYVWIDMPVEFRESEARDMAYYVNVFRNSSEAWYWNSDNSSKTYCSGLGDLIYDYGLEEVAMQRAVELIANYSHTRPDGQKWTQTYADVGYPTYNNSENIAYFYGPGAEGAVEAFKEDDYGYSGQAHRRAMLNSTYKYIGCGVIRYEDKYFYVQEFSDKPLKQSYSSPRDYESWDSARLSRSDIKDWKMEHDSVTVRIDSSGKVYDINRQMFNYRGTYLVCGWDQRYTSDNSSIVSTNDIYYSANSIGTTTLHGPAGMGNQTLSFEVHVTNQYEPVRWYWSDDHMTASLELEEAGTGNTITVDAVVTIDYDQEPTCYSSGRGTFTATVHFEGETYTDSKWGYIYSTGHSWGKPTYTWDGGKCTGTVKCLRDSSHTETKTVIASVTTIKAATCTAKGSAKYTASFSAPFTTQTKTAEVPMKSHSAVNATYKWAADHSTCTASGTCENCGKTVTETVKTTATVTREATDTTNGRVQYTAEFKTPGFKKTYSVADIPAKGKTAMYRLYNPNSYEHFYTGNAKEKDALVKMGWKYEGIGWYAPKSSKTPVYRLYNPNNGGDHHYTKNKKEYDALTKAGWKGEGIRWYSDDAKGVPVYREYNPGQPIRNHNYTANKKEHDYLVKTAGWKNEGIGWYGVK